MFLLFLKVGKSISIGSSPTCMLSTLSMIEGACSTWSFAIIINVKTTSLFKTPVFGSVAIIQISCAPIFSREPPDITRVLFSIFSKDSAVLLKSV